MTKKILITGKGSYIGTSFRKSFEKDYQIDELDLLDNHWTNFDFSPYDVIYHVAGIAHIKETDKNRHLYYEVNRDLAIDVALKAKQENVQQFIFMSSMSVYGLIHSDKDITLDTPKNPINAYGESKLQAEKAISELEDEYFKVCILRPPMVYGKGAPGNLGKLVQLVEKVHIFPTIKNKRSSISIENLIDFVHKCIENHYSGIYLPQNDYYLCTTDEIRRIMKKRNIFVFYVSLFNPLIKFLIGKNTLITKCFGDLCYSYENSQRKGAK